MTKKIQLNNTDITGLLLNVVRQIQHSKFKPDYVVGFDKNGVVPSLMLSQYLDTPHEVLATNESSLWMAEDAFGYVPVKEQKTLKSRWDISKRKNILLVLGKTNVDSDPIKSLKNDWQSSCFPNEQLVWESIWGNNVRVACLIQDDASKSDNIDYSGISVNTFENKCEFVFPWEAWWELEVTKKFNQHDF